MHLVIVESPTKAKTIKRFLGKEYSVHASMGHIRDLPKSKIGVDTEGDFEPTYEVSPEKKTVVTALKKELKNAETLWIATDEDREGEAIGWHLVEALKPGKIPVKRIVFHEITKEAIMHAIEHPRNIDPNLVDAQQARRVLDRLVGYTLSPFLWKKVYRGLSAGRVQSVVVRIIVDREREIQAFVPVEYWSLTASLQTPKGESFTAFLKQRDGSKFVPGTQEESDAVLKDLRAAKYAVSDLEEKDVKKTPPPPFTTSTLQQEAGRKLGFSVKQTMVVAQQLYEGISLGKGEGAAGLITYMRTDSVNLSEKALKDAFATIQNLYGREYVLSEPRTYKTKSKGAQEAHEAIRPTEISRTPESLKEVLDHQQLKLYTLIWNRTMATQMPPAEFRRIGADIGAGRYTFRATGQTVAFDGYLRVYSEGRDEPEKQEDAEEEGENLLPPLSVGMDLNCENLLPEQHFTKPPPRYTEASLVKKLEEEGIGRPSTYAPTISTVQARGYVRKDARQLIPEDIAFIVTDLLAEHFRDIVDLSFTAKMEQDLDNIATGEQDWVKFIKGFFVPFEKNVESKLKSITREEVSQERVVGEDPATKLPILARHGRFGPYVQLGRAEDFPEGKKPRSASLLKTMSTATITVEQALGLLSFPKTVGEHNGEPVVVSRGRFGPYISVGKVNASIPMDRDPSVLTLEDALQIVAEAAERKKKQEEPLKILGNDTVTGKPLLVKNGRFGPYVTDGETNVSLPKKIAPEDMTTEEAIALLIKKRAAPKRKWPGKKDKK